MPQSPLLFFFFFNDTATTEIYTLSLHDALPISHFRHVPGRLPLAYDEREVLLGAARLRFPVRPRDDGPREAELRLEDRKSTRLNSSHANISYAVFCLKKKKKTKLLQFTYPDN